MRNDSRNSILMTCHYLDLGSASDWPCFNQSEALPRIWVVTRYQYGISAIIYQMCLPVVASQNVRCFLRLVSFGQFLQSYKLSTKTNKQTRIVVSVKKITSWEHNRVDPRWRLITVVTELPHYTVKFRK